MIGFEVIATIVLFVLLAVATGMAIVGMLGAVGGLSLAQCPDCHRLSVNTTTWRYCPFCAPGTVSRFAHARVLHPHVGMHPHWPHLHKKA